jgi:hypothetical protein
VVKNKNYTLIGLYDLQRGNLTFFGAPNITVQSSFLLVRIQEAPVSILSPEATVLTGGIVSGTSI